MYLFVSQSVVGKIIQTKDLDGMENKSWYSIKILIMSILSYHS